MRSFFFLTACLSLSYGLWAQTNETANFSFSQHSSLKVQFTNTSQLRDTTQRKAVWNFGDGHKAVTPPLAGIEHQYARAGTYTVCLKIVRYRDSGSDPVVVAEGCKNVVVEQDHDRDSCQVGIEVGGSNSSLKKILVVQPWHNHRKKPERICWSFGDGRDTCITYQPDRSYDYAVTHEYERPGRYKTCVRVQYQGGCVAEQCQVVEAGEADGCRTEFKVERIEGAPLSRSFTAVPANDLQKKPTQICWSFGDGRDTCITFSNSFPGPYSVHHTYANPGGYKVCTRVVYEGGCVSEWCKDLTVGQSPPSDCAVKVSEIVATNNHLERRFYATLSSDRKAERICWSFGDGRDTCYSLPDPLTAQSLSIGHLYPAPGVYRLTVSVWYSENCMAHTVKEVVIRGHSSVCGAYITDSVLAPGVYVFHGFGVAGPDDRVSSYQWTFGDGSGSSGPRNTHSFAGGTYQVCLQTRSERGCEARVCKILVVPHAQAGVLQVKPNPVVAELHVVFQSTLQETVAISLFDANGVLVRSYTRSAEAGANRWTFDLATLPPGIYSIVVHSPNQLASTIFIKQ